MTDIGELAGQIIGQYELRELLGRKKLTAIYRAYQHVMRREVAVTVMSEELTSATGFLERLSAGARAASLLDHPYILPFLDYGIQTGLGYTVNRYLTGGTLKERIHHAAEQNRPPASLIEIAELLAQIASALDYAHLKAIYHDGIRPDNIIFDNRGTAHVANFGIARLMLQMSPVPDSFAYMAPERWRSTDASAAADQYGLAVIVYQLVAGRLPFESANEQQLMYGHLNEPPPSLAGTRPALPDAVSLVLDRALAKDPAARFRSNTQFAQAFKSAIEGAGGVPTGFFTFKLPKRERQPAPPSAIKVVQPARKLDDTAPSASAPSEREQQPVPPVTLYGTTKRSKKRPDATPPVSSTLPAKSPSRRTVLGLIAAALLTLVMIAVVIVIGGAAPDFGPLPIPTDASGATRAPALELLPTDDPIQASGEGCILTPEQDEAELYAEPVTIHVVTTLATIPKGSELFTAESRRGQDGFIWYRVTHDGTAGWVHSSAVRAISGKCP